MSFISTSLPLNPFADRAAFCFSSPVNGMSGSIAVAPISDITLLIELTADTRELLFAMLPIALPVLNFTITSP